MPEIRKLPGLVNNSHRPVQDDYQIEISTHRSILICIELTPDMIDSSEGFRGKSQLVEILESVKEMMSELIMVNPGTSIGCYLYYSGLDTAVNGIYELFPLCDLNIRTMKKLNDTLVSVQHDTTNPAALFQYDPEQQVNLEDLLGFIQGKCGSSNKVPGKPYEIRSVFLFTNRDMPANSTDVDVIQRLKKAVDDMTEDFINFLPFFIKTSKKPFDPTFYNDILRFNTRSWSHKSRFWSVDYQPIFPSALKLRVLRRKEIKRTLFTCPLILNDDKDFVVGLRGYNILSHEKPGSRYKLVYEKEDVRYEAFSHREYKNPKTLETVPKEDIRKLFTVGNLEFDIPGEKRANLGTDVSKYSSFLKLIGFRDSQKCIKYYNNIDKTIFISSNDESFGGSSETLASLFRTLTKKDQCMVAWGCLKSNSNPTLYIMAPAIDPGLYGGFYLWKIPFLDEIRKFPSLPTYKNPDFTRDYENIYVVTQNIVSYLTLKDGYDPSDYRSPDLQKYFKCLSDYILQIPYTGDGNVLENDDTLRKVANVRESILASGLSEDPQLQSLHKCVNYWNSVYSKVSGEDDDLGVGEVRKQTKRGSPLNLNR
ncbi:ATP-dependent DNA helicase II subunit 1 [Maudiozyma exigua]|uniref:DNA helicase n=1 Tax=Maudiozyma exigua TaxID=34358 RepID=A0A9P6WDE4_MAUEX|nr:ATP-dependent DNA helicase II subunit 1 [Kazachstania exigua]